MAFTGRTSYEVNGSDNVFKGIAEDVSELIGMISPFETPFLDQLGDAPGPAMNVLHEWLEDQLSPNTIIASTAVASLTTTSSVQVGNLLVAGQSVAPFIQVGAVIKVNATGEFLQVTAISGDYLTVSRGFGSTTATSFGAGAQLFIVSDAALEGADVTGDISQPRSRKNNYTQIFKKDVIISGTVQAVRQLGGVSNELEYQKLQRMREMIRDLEKAVINGKTSGNSIGSSTAYRTFKGVWDFLSSNSSQIQSLTQTQLNSVIATAWANGGTDLDLIVCDANFKQYIDNFNTSRVRVANAEDSYRASVTYYQSTFGTQKVVLSRWMPANSLMVVSSNRIKVLPLQGRSFQYQDVSKTGDSMKGMLVGEYTVEVKNQEGMVKCYF